MVITAYAEKPSDKIQVFIPDKTLSQHEKKFPHSNKEHLRKPCR